MSTSADDLMAEFEVGQADAQEFAADYNVAPTTEVCAVLERGHGSTVRCLRGLRWGLVPSWAGDPSIGAKLINARVETVAEKPAFRRAFAARRCLLPADGYYEWQGDRRIGRRQPYFLHPRDGGMLALAALYEVWRDRSRPDDDPAAWLWSATILTTAAQGPAVELHQRMPLVVERDDYADWLDPTNTEYVHVLLSPPHERLEAYPVSPAVNDVRAKGPHLLDPVATEPAEPTLF